MNLLCIHFIPTIFYSFRDLHDVLLYEFSPFTSKIIVSVYNCAICCYRTEFITFIINMCMWWIMILLPAISHPCIPAICVTSNKSLWTFIVNQDPDAGYIISVVSLDLEIVYLDRVFQNLMLDLFDYNILAIDQYKNVSGSKMYCRGPALYRRIEGMLRGGYDFFSIDEHVNQLTRLIYICFNNFF